MAWKVEKFIEGKPVLPVQFRFFIDGYKFYLDCHKEVGRQANYVRWLFENWSERPVPDTPINSDILFTVGHNMLRNAETAITEKFVELGTDAEQSFVPAFDIVFGVLGETSPKLKKRINEATAIIDPFYTVDFYAGGKPDIKQVQRQIWQRLKNYKGRKGDAGWNLLQENSLLLQEGKYKSQNGAVRDFEEYEKFINLFEVSRILDQTHLAITRYDIKDGGGVYFYEKGVDAKLILGLIEAKDAPDTDAICLFSNDTDYYPILEWIKEDNQNQVFLAVLEGYEFVSRVLKETVGDDCIINVKADLLPWSEVRNSPEFEQARELNRMNDFIAGIEAAQEVMKAEMDEYFRRQSNETSEKTE